MLGGGDEELAGGVEGVGVPSGLSMPWPGIRSTWRRPPAGFICERTAPWSMAFWVGRWVAATQGDGDGRAEAGDGIGVAHRSRRRRRYPYPRGSSRERLRMLRLLRIMQIVLARLEEDGDDVCQGWWFDQAR